MTTPYEIIAERIERGDYDNGTVCFRDDVLKVYGLERSKKTEKAFSLASSFSNGSGLMEELYYWDDLVELIK